MTKTSTVIDYLDSELVIGLTYPAGTDITGFLHNLHNYLDQVRYKFQKVKLSDKLKPLLPTSTSVGSEYDRVSRLMDAGNELRKKLQEGDAVARVGVQCVYNSRPYKDQPAPRVAYIIDSLKHPQEVDLLRRVYGAGFFLIGIVASEDAREKYFVDTKGLTKAQAKKIIDRDNNENEVFGQNIQETFHRSDVFIPVDDVAQLSRFLDLIFGHSLHTPTINEYSMFLAYAASLRSADLSRQVGATILSAEGEIIAVGANDVPQYRGGLYWPGPKDARDHVKGWDFNAIYKDRILTEIAEVLAKTKGYRKNVDDVKKLLKKTSLSDIIEFGRAVHAEMEALLSCGRVGVSPRNGKLFCTTFPCHLCAKHIVDAGISEVYYIEPYPKSKTKDMYPDSVKITDIVAKDQRGKSKRVIFSHFIGVGPRKYFDLFSISGLTLGYNLQRKDNSGRAVKFNKSTANLRIRLLPTSYLDREKVAMQRLKTI